MQATHGTLEVGKAELAYAIGANPCVGRVRGGNSQG
jgi:hypothetical protein